MYVCHDVWDTELNETLRTDEFSISIRVFRFVLWYIKCYFIYVPLQSNQLSVCVFVCRELDLKRPIYQKTAAYGHFGRPEFTWEQPRKLAYQ